MVKTLGLGLGLVAIAVVMVELWLRVRYGLGNPPLYVADVRTGYRLAPNQRLRRRGNRIAINQYSMRGPAIAAHRAPDTLRLLMLGDSIVNGGWWTDQGDLLSVNLEKTLAAAPAGSAVEVLNASANSWGPRNQLGYVLRYGTFEAQVVVQVLNTDDLFAIAPNSYELGRHPSYPTRRPLLAIQEAIARRRSYTPSPELQALQDQGGDRVGVNLEAIRQLQQVVLAADGQMLLAMTPLRRELEADGPRDYERVARQRLTDFTAAHGILYLDVLPQLQRTDHTDFYIDHIHLSTAGNTWLGQALAEWIARVLPQPDESAPAVGEDSFQDLW